MKKQLDKSVIKIIIVATHTHTHTHTLIIIKKDNTNLHSPLHSSTPKATVKE